MAKNRNTDWATEHARDIPVHPVASIFPMMSDEELNDLAEDIRANGLREPIVLAHMGDGYDDEVLIDGRNRYRACLLAGVEPKFFDLHTLPNVSADEGAEVISEEAVASWIISHNLHRRHLTTSQRAMVGQGYLAYLKEEAKKRQVEAVKRGNVSRHSDSPVSPKSDELGSVQGSRSDVEAAKLVGVGKNSIRDADFVVKNDHELAQQVRDSKVTVSAAAKRIREQARGSQDTGSSVLDVFDRVTEYAVVSRRVRRNMAEFARVAEKLPEQINVADLDYLQEKLDEVRRAAETGDRDGAQVGTVISFRAG